MIRLLVLALAASVQQVLILANILALDQASKITGYAIFKNGVYLKHGTIESNHSDLGIRLHHLRDELMLLINDYNIDEVIFEDIQLQDNIGNNVATFKTLAEVMGVIIELLTELNIPYTSVLAGEWRKRLSIGTGGNTRKAQKQKAQNYIRNKYTLTVSEDEADALCIGTYRIMDDEKKNAFDWA